MPGSLSLGLVALVFGGGGVFLKLGLPSKHTASCVQADCCETVKGQLRQQLQLHSHHISDVSSTAAACLCSSSLVSPVAASSCGMLHAHVHALFPGSVCIATPVSGRLQFFVW